MILLQIYNDAAGQLHVARRQFVIFKVGIACCALWHMFGTWFDFSLKMR